MDQFFIMFKNVLIFVALAIPGYILVKSKLLSVKDSAVLSKILLYIAMPFLILSSTLDIVFNMDTVIQLLIVALISLLGLLGSYFASRPLSMIEADERQRGVTRFSFVFPNNGFLGIPLAMALFSNSNPLIVSFVVIINIITNQMILILGSYTISGEKKYISFKGILTSSVLIAFVIGIALNLSNIKNIVPEIGTYSLYLKNLVTPISMTIIGMKFGEINFKSLFSDKKLYMVSLVKLVFFPIVIVGILLLIRIFIPISNEIIIATFIAFAMPIAALATTLADKFNIEGNNASIYVLGTTLFSVISLPVLYSILNVII